MVRTLLFFLGVLVSGLVYSQEAADTVKIKKEKKPRKQLKLFSGYDSTKVPQNLYVWGRVLERGKALPSATLTIRKEGVKVDKVTADNRGYFDIYVDYGFSYSVEVGKAGYVSKYFEIDTRAIPGSDRKYGYETGDFEVEIFKLVNDIDLSIYKKPVGRIHYSINTQQFVYDRKLIAEFKKEAEAVNEQIEQQLATIEAEDGEKEEEYNVLVRDADIEFESQDYKLAKDYYAQALRLRPGEDYPSKMLNKIDSLTNSKAQNQKQTVILYLAKADSAFEQKDYDNAKMGYESVLKLDNTNNYAKKQMAETNAILERLAAEAAKVEPSKIDDIDISSIEIKPTFAQRSAELVAKYPEGVTVEEFRQGNKKITLIIVVDGPKGVEYKKVKHDWGGEYFFRNSESVPKYEFNKETNQAGN